jgi:NAD+ synthase (glutamine-hydrolysing)
MRVAVAQMNPHVGDLAANGRKICARIAEATQAGCDVVVFPELALTGYPPEDLVFKSGFVDDVRRALDDVARTVTDCVAIVGFVDAAAPDRVAESPSSARPAHLANAAAVCRNGRVEAIYHKVMLPNYSVFDEVRYFVPGDVPGFTVPIAGVHVGVSICEDLWVENGPLARQREAGARIALNINGSPFDRRKASLRETTVVERARETGIPVVYVNQVCGQDELVFDGGSVVVGPDGAVVARLEQFEERCEVVDVVVDGAVSRAASSAAPGVGARRDARIVQRAPEVDQVLGALALGTRDYVRKNGFTDVVVGLSGGIDSALVAAVAVEALGADHVHGVAMPSRYSSEGSLADAAALAHNLGIDFRTIPIEPAFAAYLDMTAPSFAGRAHDLAEENLQSRVRGTTLMALSNKFGWMVLTTGNKSELAVGYFTLYGDSVGGYAVIKDVFKTEVYELCRRINERAGSNVIPVATLTKPPSAELRPDQRDDQSLPPYDVLDPILRSYVEEDRTAADIVAGGVDSQLVARIVRLVDTNEYKRRQLPPGVRVTTKAFGKDRRLPITHGYRG